jgi:hypothetical protein
MAAFRSPPMLLPSHRSPVSLRSRGWNDQATRARVVSTDFNQHLTKPADVNIVL